MLHGRLAGRTAQRLPTQTVACATAYAAASTTTCVPVCARSCSSLPVSTALHTVLAATALTTRGGVCCTRVLLRDRKPMTSANAVEAWLTSESRLHDIHGSSSLELNLMEDPTAGLATGPAEELTPTELETRVRVLVSSYSPSLYRLLYTPFIDVVAVLVREGLVPDENDLKHAATTITTTTTAAAAAAPAAGRHGSGDGAASWSASRSSASGGGGAVSTSARPVRPEEIMSRWFTDGPSTLKHPHRTAEAMGKRRWGQFCRALEAHWAGMEAVMPLTRVVRRHGLKEELYVPLLRQLAMELVDPTKRAAAVATLPGFILSLANGRAPRSLGLPEKDADRVPLISSLFLGVAQETGDTDLAYLALQLLRANNIDTPFAAQKQLTNVFAASSRMENDWQMRAASLLSEVYGNWLDYFRAVQHDNKAALEKLEAATASDKPERERGGSEGAGAAAAAAGRRQQLASSSSAASPSDRAKSDAEADAAEQYRYFTSRRQDDVTRLNALEANIEAAVRARAAELQGVRRGGRRARRGAQPQTKAGALAGEAVPQRVGVSAADATAGTRRGGEAVEEGETDGGFVRDVGRRGSSAGDRGEGRSAQMDPDHASGSMEKKSRGKRSQGGKTKHKVPQDGNVLSF